jgi:hypothetical protein
MAGDDSAEETAGDRPEDSASRERPVDVWARSDRPTTNPNSDAGIVPFDDLHFHRFCDLIPMRVDRGEVVTDRGRLAYLRSLWRAVELVPPPGGDGGADTPRRTTGASVHDRSAEPTDHEEPIRYLPSPEDDGSLPLTGLIRTALRYTPLVVGCLALVFLVAAELAPGVEGASAYLSSLPLVLVPAGAGGAVLWGVLAYLVVGAGLVSGRELAKAVAVYGLVAVLALGTAVSVFLVLTAERPDRLDPNIVYTAGYLLLILVGGLLTYDAMLRTEYLFDNLGRKLIVDEDATGAYEAFRLQVAERLDHHTEVLGRSVPTYLLFAPLLVSQFAAVWAFAGNGPQNLSFQVTFWANVLVDLVLAVIYFQLFVLIKAFHDLVTGNVTLYRDDDGNYHPDDGTDDPDASPRAAVEVDLLSYRPFHPDGYGGFRDFGKFATRVNVLLILGGLYVTYRLYVQGARALPATEVALDTALTTEVLVWGVSYVGPVVVLIVVAFAWLYYSFWTLHVKMAAERERAYIEWAYRRRESDDEPTPVDTPLGAVEDATDWQERRGPAPVWPVDSRLLASLVSSSLVPLLLALPRFLL